MKYLEKFDFNKEQLNQLKIVVPEDLYKLFVSYQKLVEANLAYLKTLGVNNYQDIFLKYYDMFLLDNSTFISIFDKYEKEDLVEKLKKNINIVEYL